MLLAQAQEIVQAGTALGGMDTSAVLGIVTAALAAAVLALWRHYDAKLDKITTANDALQEARIADLKQAFKDLSGTKEAA